MMYQETVNQNKAEIENLISNKNDFKPKKYKGQRWMIILVKGTK